MTELNFINTEDGKVLFSIESNAVPNIHESVAINGEWYDVIDRAFCYDTTDDGGKRFYWNLWLKYIG